MSPDSLHRKGQARSSSLITALLVVLLSSTSPVGASDRASGSSGATAAGASALGRDAVWLSYDCSLGDWALERTDASGALLGTQQLREVARIGHLGGQLAARETGIGLEVILFEPKVCREDERPFAVAVFETQITPGPLREEARVGRLIVARTFLSRAQAEQFAVLLLAEPASGAGLNGSIAECLACDLRNSTERLNCYLAERTCILTTFMAYLAGIANCQALPWPESDFCTTAVTAVWQLARNECILAHDRCVADADRRLFECQSRLRCMF